MGVLDLFSKRQKRARGEMPDVFQYNTLPNGLRVQIVHIIRDAFGTDKYGFDLASSAYEFVNDSLCREYGVFKLGEKKYAVCDEIFSFFLQEKTIDRALDVVELSFKMIVNYIGENRDNYRNKTDRKISSSDAVSELNERLKEHGVGYQFESGEIIRVDSEFLHSEAVKPVLSILRGSSFKGANEEFLHAHEHYRHGRYKECLVDALKSFESTMKTICHLRGWAVQPGDTAKNLISVCLNNGLVPSYLGSQVGSLRSLLESGVPTVRNRNGGHGQGAMPVAVPEYIARFALNLTATNILFMVEANAASE